jgi:hypothetical protein
LKGLWHDNAPLDQSGLWRKTCEAKAFSHYFFWPESLAEFPPAVHRGAIAVRGIQRVYYASDSFPCRLRSTLQNQAITMAISATSGWRRPFFIKRIERVDRVI